MSISWEFECLDDQELHGNQAYDTDQDFESKSDAKKHLKQMFKNYQCLNCGGRNINGYGIVVEICKTKMYKQHLKKGILWGEKYVDEHWKTIWRVKNIYAKKGGFFGGAGFMECKSCKTKMKGGNSFWGAWETILADAKRGGN